MPPMPPAPAMTEQPSMEQKSSGGYRICLDRLPDGTFRVSGKQPLPPAGADENGTDATSLEEAMKVLIGIVQENPMADATAQEGFEAGYGDKPQPKPSMKPGMTPGMMA